MNNDQLTLSMVITLECLVLEKIGRFKETWHLTKDTEMYEFFAKEVKYLEEIKRRLQVMI